MEALRSFDLEISDDLFSLFSELIYATSGIKLGAQKKGLLISRLAKRLQTLGTLNYYDYFQRVKSDNDELVEMLNCVSTHTTKFFRENYHFEYFSNNVIPELLRSKSEEKTIRIWSAGCSTGEEAYSIAIALHEALSASHPHSSSNSQFLNHSTAFSPDWDVKILATDISTKVLDVAMEGVYESEQLPDDMPQDKIARYFLKGVDENGGKIKVKDFIRDGIIFRRLNLKEMTLPFRKTFDVIFCRNVMIYFDESMKRHVLSMFFRHLAGNGHLFLGHSEAMIGNERFKPVYITVYKKTDLINHEISRSDSRVF